MLAALELRLEFQGQGACRWVHPPYDQSEPLAFHKTIKGILLSDVEKKKPAGLAEVYFGERGQREDGLDENRQACSKG